MRIVRDLAEARRLLSSARVGDEQIPVSLLDGIESIFRERIPPEQAVRRILQDVGQRGDAALESWVERIDGLSGRDWQIPAHEIQAAAGRIDSSLRQAIRQSAERIREFHERQPVSSWTTTSLGGVLGQRVVPLGRVGVYVPGGTAPLPSSLMMAAIPAQVAGVKEIVVCTPPGNDDGKVNDAILAAADEIGVTSVYRLGGAQAIAALAFGTESIVKVDKIVGPGNLFVTLAKREVFGQVGLDGLAGPTETVVIGDDSANPAWIAADLLAQAEHDVMATAILLTDSDRLAVAVEQQLAAQLQSLARSEIARQSIDNRGCIIVTPDIETAVDLANQFAPEHLCLSLADSEKWAELVTNAGGIFLGERSCEVLGDYIAGPSHIMPTGGTARFASPVNVWDFVKIISIIHLDDSTTKALAGTAAELADAEGLTAHAQAARIRS